MEKLIYGIEFKYEDTPNGGFRSEAHYFDKNGNYVKDKTKAEYIILKEYDLDNKCIQETRLIKDENSTIEEIEILDEPRKLK